MPPPPPNAILLLPQFPGAVVPVALAEAQFIEDEGDEGAVVEGGPFGVVVVVGGFGLSFWVLGYGEEGGGVVWWGGVGGGGGEGVGERGEVGAVEAEGEGGWVGALAFGGGGSGALEVFLVARRSVLLGGRGAAALEVAARWLGCRGFGVLRCVRLWLFRGLGGAGRGCEDDGAAEVGGCADGFGARGEGREVAGQEGLQCATGAVHVGAIGRLAG